MITLNKAGVYFDSKRNRLVYISHEATPDMWHDRWEIDEQNLNAKLATKDERIVKITSRFLRPRDGIILEGGCGYGVKVKSLMETGYKVIGVDFDFKTVSCLNKNIPEMDIRFGDVRELPMEDSSVAGYWSFGVIEHFYYGFHGIVSEMSRVLKPGGYLFLAHPYMSPLRKMKARLGFYPNYHDHGKPDNFYQFALDHRYVVGVLKSFGFELCLFKWGSGLLGLKKEIPFYPVRFLSAYDGKIKFIRGLRRIIDKTAAPFASHGCLMVYRLKKNDRQDNNRFKLRPQAPAGFEKTGLDRPTSLE